ncbi:MAG: carbohydrate ABC transporter permease, partial [Actinomycetota bacterium]|nr:carbohydrate ABC transporter permease [Actinomycetota bacterium]
MATAEVTVQRPAASTSERITRMLAKTPVHVGLLLVGFIWLVPSVGLLITSVRLPADITGSSWWSSLLDWRYTLNNYETVLDRANMADSFVNSLIITIPSTLLPLAVAAAAAYAFSWIRFPLRDTVFLLIVALMVVPIQMALVPLLRLFRDMGIANNFGGIILAHTAFGLPLGVFLLRNFFIALPRDLIEAARVDGASNLRIFTRVVLPLSVPALASYAIFQFLWVWNDLLMALVFVQNSDLWPMTIRINQMQSQFGIEWHLLSAGAFLLMA